MAGRVVRILVRILFFACGAVSLVTAALYAFLHGANLPAERDWIIFTAALGLVGGFSALIAVLPRSWIARMRGRSADDQTLFARPLTLLGIFAAVFYLLAVGAFLTPRTWNLDPLFMLSLCPMYVIRMNVDPPPAAIFFVLAPMNAATYGALGAAAGFILGAVRKPR